MRISISAFISVCLTLSLFSCAAPLKESSRRAEWNDMILIQKGWFLMGSDFGDLNERPAHEVYLDTFYIDRYEVSAGDFAEFLNDKGNPENKYFSKDKASTILGISPGEGKKAEARESQERYTAKEGFENYPANNVSWFGADAYCRSKGKRLPTEAEWEKAARGRDERPYPWGYSEPDDSKARYSQAWKEKRLNVMAPVDEMPEGASYYGAFNMAGNVREWTGDWFRQNYCDYCDPNGEDYLEYAAEISGADRAPETARKKRPDFPPRENPRGPEIGSFKVLRGGSWANRSAEKIRSSHRYWNDPAQRDRDTGFRCASTTLPEQPVIPVISEEPVPVTTTAEPVEPPPIIEEEPRQILPIFEPVYFDFDRSNIREDAELVLETVTDWLKGNESFRMLIIAHCDERGSNGYNLALAERRSSSVKEYLVSRGISEERLDTISYGEERPVCWEKDKDCWQEKRRVDFKPIPYSGSSDQ